MTSYSKKKTRKQKNLENRNMKCKFYISDVCLKGEKKNSGQSSNQGENKQISQILL
jgi:hypothetical protein